MSKRPPIDWETRLSQSLELHPAPALEPWRWAREGEGPADALAVTAAWDLAAKHASAEASLLNRAMKQLENEESRVLFAALVIAGARHSDVGALEVVGPDGRRWRPRDLPLVPGREPLPATLRLECGKEVGLAALDFFLSYEHLGYVEQEHALHPVRASLSLGIFCPVPEPDERTVEQHRRDRTLDLELEVEGHLLHRITRSELWADPVGAALKTLTRLVDATRQAAGGRSSSLSP